MRSFLAHLNLILTLHCDEASRLTSESFERRLDFHERVAMRFHVVLCRSCRRFRKQLELLHEAFRNLSQSHPDHSDLVPIGLSDEMKERIKARLREQS